MGTRPQGWGQGHNDGEKATGMVRRPQGWGQGHNDGEKATGMVRRPQGGDKATVR